MSSDVFRFVTIRPGQQSDTTDPAGTVVDLGQFPPSLMVAELHKLRPTATRSAMLAVVAKYRSSADFIDSHARIDPTLVTFLTALQSLRDPTFWSSAQQTFTKVFKTQPGAFIKTPLFTTTSVKAVNSVVVATMDSSVSPNVRSFLVRFTKALWLIRRLADSQSITQQNFVSAPLALPNGIFPLPTSDTNLRTQEKAQADAANAARDARRKRLTTLFASLTTTRQAINELLNSLTSASAPATTLPPAASAVNASRPAPATGFVLTDAAVRSLSDSTRSALSTIGAPVGTINVSNTLALLEQRAATLASQLYADPSGSSRMVRLGNLFIPQDALVTIPPVVIDPGPTDSRSPGPCAPVPVYSIPVDSTSVPTGHGEARVLGVADLMVVEQDLVRYQLGEIAHVENVLKSEFRSRKFKTSDTTKQTVTTETEITADRERDLSSAERFELQTESQTVISDNASKDVGLTIHASYGPSVDATSNFNASSSSASQQSNSVASSYAREITTKAVERVQTRTLTRRTVTTINVIKEADEHTFDNKTGLADITGIYRYLDKVYRAQVVNYGKRLMLEFIVPEPASFLRYALTSQPIADVTVVKPDPPGYCLADGQSFAPLQATDLSRDNYLYWASKYGAQDVTPPPPLTVIATGSKKAPDSMPTAGDRLISSDLLDVTIPDGYLTQNAFVNIYGETQSGIHRVVYQLQDQQGEYVEPPDDHVLYALQPAPNLTVSINSNGFHNYEVVVTVLCTVSDEKFNEWQLKTFASIMSAYLDAKSAYDQAVREATLQQSDTAFGGSNPDANAMIEQIELKKGCISLLTGQRFDLFDAVVANATPYGYPEIDFAAAHAEGPYIRMFEQSFEWNNMVYVFYPYFWGRKDEWVTLAQLTDNDPLYQQFLRAGAARVQVPVRAGFEAGILGYLSTGEIWAGDGTVVNSGDQGAPDLSIIDEFKSQTGNNDTEGVGTLEVSQNAVAVTGTGTAFESADQNRRIVIAGVTYVIGSVQDALTITLSTLYAGPSAQGLGYALGGWLVGQPWEIKLPTNLVKLDSSMPIS